MRKELLIIALGLTVLAGQAAAEVLAAPEAQATAPEAQPAPPMKLPLKGASMSDVEKKFGEPRAKQPTVGGETEKHPPITRWDYDGFVVVFERDKVIDAVVPGAPPKIFHKDQLQPVSSGTAPPPPAMPEASAPAAATTEAPAPSEPAAPAQPAPGDQLAPDETQAAPANVATPENPNPDRPPPPTP